MKYIKVSDLQVGDTVHWAGNWWTVREIARSPHNVAVTSTWADETSSTFDWSKRKQTIVFPTAAPNGDVLIWDRASGSEEKPMVVETKHLRVGDKLYQPQNSTYVTITSVAAGKGVVYVEVDDLPTPLPLKPWDEHLVRRSADLG